MQLVVAIRCGICAAAHVACAPPQFQPEGDVPCATTRISSKPTAFEVTSKRRKGFPSESRVKRGERVVGGSKELLEKLGRNDPCPCNSGRRFQTLLHEVRLVRWFRSCSLLLGDLSPDTSLERTGRLLPFAWRARARKHTRPPRFMPSRPVA
jgi:hypothetical protein